MSLRQDSHLLGDEHPSEKAQLQEVNNSLGFILARSNCYSPNIKIVCSCTFVEIRQCYKIVYSTLSSSSNGGAGVADVAGAGVAGVAGVPEITVAGRGPATGAEGRALMPFDWNSIISEINVSLLVRFLDLPEHQYQSYN